MADVSLEGEVTTGLSDLLVPQRLVLFSPRTYSYKKIVHQSEPGGPAQMDQNYLETHSYLAWALGNAHPERNGLVTRVPRGHPSAYYPGS